MGEIFFLRQKARENFDSTMAGRLGPWTTVFSEAYEASRCLAIGDEEMLQDLWNSLFPTLPYEGRVNSRWRDVGFQVSMLISECLRFSN